MLRKWVCIGLVLASITPWVCAGKSKKPSAVKPIKALIVTPDPKIGFAGGIVKLLGANGITAKAVGWKECSAQTAKVYDVVIVTGNRRWVDAKAVVLDLGKPILAYGPYGCKYLGLMRLKNGHPYT